MNRVDYKSAGVNIDAGNEAVERIKSIVRKTHTSVVLTDIGSFGSLYDLSSIKNYKYPVLVQSIDGVGTKTIVAKMANQFDTIGVDLVSACCNDIAVLGAKPLTFLDYIANDKLNPEIIEIIVAGIANACQQISVALVGGETAEMPNTYLPGEHDLVGVVTGIIERDQIIDGHSIEVGDVVIGLPSSGLHTNGYSLARKVLFEIGNFKVADKPEELPQTIGEALLAPHINYTNIIQQLINNHVHIKGLAHITGGGLRDNIPRVLPDNCSVSINSAAWQTPPIFLLIQKIGGITDMEMYRTFNMGVGLVAIVPEKEVSSFQSHLNSITSSYVIGRVIPGNGAVKIL
ncbi:phosphoribosylformylglycinamidine cyclo-ligase [Candidatus Neomarinimicrobiota bacterium]